MPFSAIIFYMAVISQLWNSLTNPSSHRQMGFDITLLPLNLSEGRNIGELQGLFLFTSPKKAESSRQSDVLIMLMHPDKGSLSESQMKEWAEVFSGAYFSSRGSLTMGVSYAIRKLTLYITKKMQSSIIPAVFLNVAILRERTLLIAHAGPVNTTVISSDHVQNFCEETSLPLQMTANDPIFFTTQVQSEDIILLCPKVPGDWTNASIMEVTGDSPLNAIRFLLDRSGGNIQAAVIQIKTGKGKITFKTRTQITANVQPEFADKIEAPSVRRRRSSNLINSISEELPDPEKPLFRKRKISELFEDTNRDPVSPIKNESQSDMEIVSDESNQTVSLTGEQELPGAQKLDFNFIEDTTKTSDTEAEDDSPIVDQPASSESELDAENKPTKKKKRKLGSLLLFFACGILIPATVAAVLFFIYSGRSKSDLYREYLAKAVDSAQQALNESNSGNQVSLWTDTLDYVEQASKYGNSTAARTLRREAMQKIDSLCGGISTVYNYANQAKLPQGINITEIASSGQYTYALDSGSGSVLKFISSGNGLALDNSFSCVPGVYKDLNNDSNTIKVGPLIDFVILPLGSPHNFVLAGVDADANVLYCSGFTDNQAGKLIKPTTEKLSIKGITMLENAMYLMDTQASAVWEYVYSKADGFKFEPTNYYGSYSPYLSDAIDFVMYKEYAYFLRSNGTLLICDYTGYRPTCQNIPSVQNEDGSIHIDMSLHKFRKILINASPDNSIYIMDAKFQSLLNLSAKGTFIRYIVPNRDSEEISQYAFASGFGITGQNQLLWGFRNDLYIGNMP